MQTQTTEIQQIPVRRLHTFRGHPFQVKDDEKMQELVDSIRERGIVTPVVVRPSEKGEYELISGHRRTHAAGIVGLETVPAIVREMSDDEATVAMIDATVSVEEDISQRFHRFYLAAEDRAGNIAYKRLMLQSAQMDHIRTVIDPSTYGSKG